MAGAGGQERGQSAAQAEVVSWYPEFIAETDGEALRESLAFRAGRKIDQFHASPLLPESQINNPANAANAYDMLKPYCFARSMTSPRVEGWENFVTNYAAIGPATRTSGRGIWIFR